MPDITNYKQATAYLAGGRNPDDRPLPGNGTRLQRREDNSIAVNYRGTDVVTYEPDGRYRLNRGGWNTLTTQNRMEEYSPFRVVAGALETSWSYHREYVRRGPDDWQIKGPDGTVFEIQDGHPIAI